MAATHDIVAEIAATGTLRAAINTANFLLVTGTSDSGDPQGVAPDFAQAVATRLGVPLTLVPFANAGLAGDAVADGRCDIALIGAEPARAEKIAFSAAYTEIEATYLVQANAPLASIADVDRPGVRIAVCAGSAYDLWLTRHIVHAELVRAPTIPASRQLFVDDGLEALAGLRPGLLTDRETLRGTRLLDGRFTSIQQAVGTGLANAASIPFLSAFVEEAKQSGLVGQLIERHGVRGLSVASL